MVDSILASANQVPRVLFAHAKNTTRVLRGPIRLLACTHPTPREFFFNLLADGTVCVLSILLSPSESG